MSQPLIPQLKMLSVLQIIEKRTISSLDNALLEEVAGACQSIGSQILTAFEGEQRAIFQDLCIYTTEQNINRADPKISSPFSALIPITMLFGTGVLIQLILVRDHPRLVRVRHHPYLRKIRLSLRQILSLVDCTWTRRRTVAVAIAHPARSSTVATLEQVSPTQDQPVQTSPAFAPLPPDVIYRMVLPTTSEWKSDIGVELDHSPSRTKRKALSEKDAEDDVDDNAEDDAEDDEKSEGYSHPRKKRKATFCSQTITQPA